MNKLAAFALTFVLLLASVAPASAAATTPFPAELEYYDAQISVLLPRLESFQAQYHSLTGRYFQALQSNSSAPSVPVPPDGISGSPTDQSEDLAYFWDAAALPEMLAWSYRIDTYKGPDGDGYVLTISTTIEGAVWEKAVNFGPEDWRGYEWMTY